ncbi:MAG TPA: hypothetical protein VEX62_12960, partial [Candidatus Limnocylindrales bacterium]|nr:hypothetical protein [Candidatus Limnocylindrales bacterium]
MTEPATAPGWQLAVNRTADLPPMAWLLRARTNLPDGPLAAVTCGELVASQGEGIFEGTWVGESGVAGIRASTTTFGSGVLLDRGALHVVPPSHLLETVYLCRRPGEVVASNSLVGLLVAADLELDPDVDYPARFGKAGEGTMRFSIPTTSLPIEAVGFDGVRIEADGSLTDVEKPREGPFSSFADVRSRLSEALRTSLANAPGFEPVATISSGYDSASMATLASELGCRRALTVVEGKPVRGSSRTSDSGEAVARNLGMDVQLLRRLAYLERDDFPEASFLSTGATGEDIVLSEAGPSLARTVLITGFFGDGMWWLNRPKRSLLWRLEQAGMSLGEWRIQAGFIHVPLP